MRMIELNGVLYEGTIYEQDRKEFIFEAKEITVFETEGEFFEVYITKEVGELIAETEPAERQSKKASIGNQ